jgi:hypothetical protein
MCTLRYLQCVNYFLVSEYVNFLLCSFIFILFVDQDYLLSEARIFVVIFFAFWVGFQKSQSTRKKTYPKFIVLAVQYYGRMLYTNLVVESGFF